MLSCTTDNTTGVLQAQLGNTLPLQHSMLAYVIADNM
jgi:hypothetical protein